MDILHSILFLIGVFATALCLTLIIKCVREDNEKRRLKRRAKFRKKAYEDMQIESCKNHNREWLSTVYLR